jgi:hypothetical protein
VPARLTVLGAFLEGWRRVFRAPAILAGVFALFLSFWWTSHEQPAELTRRVIAQGQVDPEEPKQAIAVANEFTTRTHGLGWLVIHDAEGFGAATGLAYTLVLEISAGFSLAPLTGVGGGTSQTVWILVLWTFLSAGIIDRLARDRLTRTGAFFAVAGVNFFRFLRLGIPIGLAYWLLFRWIYPWLIGDVYVRLTAGGTSRAIAIHVAVEVVFLVLLLLVGIVGDLAKVRLVIEDRRSVLGALLASIRFFRRRFWRTLTLYLLYGTAMFLGLAIMFNAPALTGFRFAMAFMWFMIAYQTVLKFAVMGSLAAFFQSELAHAGYTAAPVLIWPDSPAAEGIRNLVQGRGQKAEDRSF